MEYQSLNRGPRTIVSSRRRPLAQYAVLVTYREVLGKEPELADLHALLGKYQRKEALFLLAKLNCLLGTWQNALDFDVDIKLTRILLSSYYSQIDKLRRTSGERVLFSRITLLYLAKQACIVCGGTGAMMDHAQSYEAIGLACLMANDLMLPFTPSPRDGTLEKLANVLPFTDLHAARSVLGRNC